MSGNFTNLIYDKQAYNEQLERSTRPMEYRLDPNYYNSCKPCYSSYGSDRGHAPTMDIGDQIDVDSILKGITKINSKSNAHQIPDSVNQYRTKIPTDCGHRMDSEHTRYTNPSYDIRGLNVPDMRFSYPLHDPQCNIFEPFAVNTRLQAKDNHRTPWQIPIDQSAALPVEKKRAKRCRVTINCD